MENKQKNELLRLEEEDREREGEKRKLSEENVRLYEEALCQVIQEHGKGHCNNGILSVIRARDKKLPVEANDVHLNLINLPTSCEVEELQFGMTLLTDAQQIAQQKLAEA